MTLDRKSLPVPEAEREVGVGGADKGITMLRLFVLANIRTRMKGHAAAIIATVVVAFIGYLAIMQEVADGHLLAASVPFFEYKDSYPLIPPTIPALYALASKILGITLPSVLLLSKLVLPAALFLLVYFFLLAFLEPRGTASKLTAVAGGLLVVLGFDLIDYRMLGKFLQGDWPGGSFLIWTRSVNPISGALFLFTLCTSLWFFFKRNIVIPAGVSLALMMWSYFFSWTLAVALICSLGLFAVIRKEWDKLRFLLLTLSIGTLLALPYFIMMGKASSLPWYAEAATRIGLLSAHAPHLNKFLLAVLLVFLAFSYLKCVWQDAKRDREKDWWWFSAALL
ncbi:MAG: hypothetical protein Greene041679_647, partial [Parcubacteria group bacterium Greene0416_79]